MNKKLIFVLATLVATTAQAEIVRKAPLKVDFHALINKSQKERDGLAGEVTHDRAQKNPAEGRRIEKGRVTDFVDVEIGWGEAPQMVDRRFDSVGEPIVAIPACPQTLK